MARQRYRRINDVFRMGIIVIVVGAALCIFGPTANFGIFLLVMGVILLALGAATA